MKPMGVFEAKTHFSALVNEAIAGHTTVITKNGEPVAELSPIKADRSTRAQVALARLRAMRSSLKGPRISARDLIDEGRR